MGTTVISIKEHEVAVAKVIISTWTTMFYKYETQLT